MLSKVLLAFSLLLTLNGSATCAKADDVSSFDSLRFFGRWDLRIPNRAITVNSGSYVLAQFTGTSIEAHFDTSLNQAPSFPTITWKVDQGAWQESEVAAKVPLASGLPAGPHTLWLMVRALDEHQSRWNAPLVASVTFLGLDFPDGGNVLPPLAEWDHPKLKIEFLGDSITEGVLVQKVRPGKTSWAWQTDALDSHACKTAMLLGAAWRQVGFGATGLAHGGSGGAPGALDSFNFFYAGCPRDSWQPDLVVVNQGTNDGNMPAAQYQPLYAKYLAMIRQAYPQATIAAERPFDGAQAAGIKQTVEAMKAAGDNNVHYIDTTGWYPSPQVHPDAEASTGIASKLAPALEGILPSAQ
jgi:lysophospholipase L1-like esterase